MESKNPKVVPNITAFIDLLGFNSYLELGKNDLRTEAGKLALKRLDILKDAVSLINQEKKDYPERYPPNFFIRIITDSIIVSADIDEAFLPSVGRQYDGGYDIEDIRRLTKEMTNSDGKMMLNDAIAMHNGFLLGAIARIHLYINTKDKDSHGCRTTINLGLRFKSEDEDDDFLARNFAFSLSWKTNELGSKHKLAGPNIYLERSAALTICPETTSQKILRISKFELESLQNRDPYEKYVPISVSSASYNKVIENKEFEVNLYHLKLNFRKVNPIPLTSLQFIPNLNLNKIEDSYKEMFENYFKFLETPDKEILDAPLHKRGIRDNIPLNLVFHLEKNDDYLFER